ncbi:threonine synthase [Oceanispirochaeta sp.]|uniref:threonine synthase n=1 Tax=Oceanispirochaeta sp. TaxID=2035350 RepID=UPI002634576A|nr:threonine synthase [Oceanispirochaeta sp.]MDA3957194.1 threonine synthase [Oceanispirochaeta sp.]
MKFASTRNKDHIVSFQEALFQGLSPDGGLYYPLETVDLKSIFSDFSSNSSFQDIASTMISSLLGDEIPESDALILAQQAFPFSPKLKKLNDRINILELYHGPSSAFKDFGASFLANSMEYFLANNDRKAVILTATSGDTGSAVARAFYNKANIEVVILYPSGRVSPLQEKQMTTLGNNIHALEVMGSFDDCQKMVKDSFTDTGLKGINLSSANSINLGRLIPQSFYYIWAECRLRSGKKPVRFCVPSGNFGNLTAGLYAKSWGLNVDQFIAATNKNDIVPAYLKNGVYNPKASVQTFSNAMDVGAPSNFERMQILYENDIKRMRLDVQGIMVDDKDTLKTMKMVADTYDYAICPHTAVGIKAAMEMSDSSSNITVLSTAHPGKFTEVFEKAVGVKPELPESLLAVKNLDKKCILISNKSDELKKTLLSMFS